MTHPEDSFIPPNRKANKFLTVEQVPDPKTEEDHESNYEHLIDAPEDPVHPDQRRKVSREDGSITQIPERMGGGEYHAPRDVDHMGGVHTPLPDQHDTLEKHFDKQVERDFFRTEEEKIYGAKSQDQVQGRRGKEPSSKHKKGGGTIRGSETV